MKTLKALVAEVDQPKSAGDRAFKAKHKIQQSGADDDIETLDNLRKTMKKDQSRKADQDDGKDVAAYESMDFDDDLLSEDPINEISSAVANRARAARRKYAAENPWTKTANSAHTHHLAHADVLARSIHKHLSKMSGDDLDAAYGTHKKEVDWGHVGTMEHVHQKLKEIHSYLGLDKK